MAISVQQVRDKDRGFADASRYPDTLIAGYLSDFFTFIGAWRRFPDTVTAPQTMSVRDTAQLDWVCHQLTAQANGAAGKAGAVTSQKVGDVQVDYAKTSDLFGAPDYSLSTYGTNFLRLTRPYAAYAVCVG